MGLDISKGMMAKAKEKGLTALVFADIQRVPFRDEAFEAALLVHVLHLVSDWLAVVREAARVSRGTIISVIDTGELSGRDVMREEYRDMRLKEGFPLNRFGKGEEGFREIIAPDRLVSVVEAERAIKADEEIRHLAERGQSVTWGVPDESHNRIITHLTGKYGGTTFRSKSRLEVAVWSTARLRLELPADIQKG